MVISFPTNVYGLLFFSWQKQNESTIKSRDSLSSNIILNHDFSRGLHSWNLNCCNGSVVSAESGFLEGISVKSGGNYAVITNRKECWQGLEQDITSRVSLGSTYSVSACVGVSGSLQGSAVVQATLKLEYQGSATSYLFIGRWWILFLLWFPTKKLKIKKLKHYKKNHRRKKNPEKGMEKICFNSSYNLPLAEPLYQESSGRNWKGHSHCQLCLTELYFTWKALLLDWTFS